MQPGIKVVVVDQLATSPDAYPIENDQVAYGKAGMQWPANQLHGKGNIVLLQGAARAPADTNRCTGIKSVLAKYPGIHVIASPHAGWTFTEGAKAMSDLLSSKQKIDGVWTSGMDYTAVNAFQNAGKPFVPIIGADTNGFVEQLHTYKNQGLVGAVVTNPSTIVGTGMAPDLLAGKGEPKMTKLTPAVWNNLNNVSTLKSAEFLNRGFTFTNHWRVPGWTTYTKTQFLNMCKG